MTVAVFIAAAGPACAGAWLQQPGEGEMITTTVFSDSTRYFDANGRLIPIPAYTKFSLGTYIEYGLSDEFTLIAQPFFDSDRQNTTPAPAALVTGGTDIGLRAGIFKSSDTVISAQITAHVPFVTRTPLVNFDQDSIFAGDIRLLLGHSFIVAGMDGFVNLEGSYRLVTADEPDEWHADATLGVRTRHDILLLFQSFATFATRETQVSPRYDWVKFQESVVYDVAPHWSLQGGFFETVIGTNAGRELGPMAALWYRF